MLTMSSAKALGYALKHHKGQVRKYTGTPYIEHPIEVAKIVQKVRPYDEKLIAAAYLHDLIEDTSVTYEDLKTEFGEEVANLVWWVTDASRPEDGNRQVRKAKDRLKLAKAPARAQTLKLADMIDNTKNIVARDPSFAPVYLREKASLLEVLTRGDPNLFAQAKLQIEGHAE